MGYKIQVCNVKTFVHMISGEIYVTSDLSLDNKFPK